MRRTHLTALFALVVALTTPAFAASPLDDPGAHGMVRVTQGIWAEARMDEAARAALTPLVDEARRRVARYYGTLADTTNVVFCASDTCYRHFGAHGLGFSDGEHVLIAPRGRRAAIIAHELAHVELASRLGGMDRVNATVPQWFDEGLAVMISAAEEFNERAWQAATHGGRTAPALEALAGMASWNRITGPDGAGMHLSYGTACRELKRWARSTGTDGPRAMVAALRNQEPFAAAYRRIELLPSGVPSFAVHAGEPWSTASTSDGQLSPQTIRDSVDTP